MLSASSAQVQPSSQTLEKETSEIAKELAGFEREDAQLQEKKKHASGKRKKLEKSIKEVPQAALSLLVLVLKLCRTRILCRRPRTLLAAGATTR